MPPEVNDHCLAVQRLLRERRRTVAVAESLTGGLICAALVDTPGASAVVRGGVVAYATALKHDLLGVDGDLLAARGAVHPEVAAQMAQGVRDRLGADWGLASTGVAGPDPQDGVPPGRVHLAVVGPGRVAARTVDLPGGRSEVRQAATAAAIALLHQVLTEQP